MKTLSSTYSALIRTFNSESTLPATLGCLEGQSTPPSQYVVIDSGSTDRTLDLLPQSAVVERYIGESFNYSRALNQGIRHIEHSYTLIVSSHTRLQMESAISFGLSLLAGREDVAAAYFLPGEASDRMSFELVTRENFTGFNGVFNTCGIFKTEMLKKRGFRPEVFSAEDQEWSKWLLEVEGKHIARISGAGMLYENPIRDRRQKDLHEDLAVALYVRPEMFEFPHLIRLAIRAARPGSDMRERTHSLRLLRRLIYYRLRGKPETIDIFARQTSIPSASAESSLEKSRHE